jgi:phage shock protein PspC (stress-responsive transcriptional regulator)
MQRVVSINLNGNVYQLEEKGYNALFAYLDAFDAHLKDAPDRAERLAELEARVAELCSGCLAPHKTVVTSMEIDRIVAGLGPIPEQAGTSGASAGGAASQSTSAAAGAGSAQPFSTGPFAHRRLYQIREGSMISGVCMGLAEYMHVDVTFIRIMFGLFALVTSGWGVMAYAALMFILPRVETRAAAGAHDAAGTMPPYRWPWDNGWPWDKHGWPWDKYGWPWDPPRPPPPPASAGSSSSVDAQAQPGDPQQQGRDARQQARYARQEARDARREWRAERRAARLAYQPVSSWWGSFAMILSIVFAFFWLSLWTRGHFFFGWPYFWGFPHWVGIIIFFVVMRMIFVPSPRWSGYGYGPYAHPHYGWVAMWNGLAWFVLMIFGIWAAYHLIPEFHDFLRTFEAGYDYRL